ncbi:hypothetical protein JQ615_19545 [Bradyrhizobium jicamae]|uniref:Uncharacterized protein n=1 Tax=Bradyrhizobium jicamae TaxID=280332 RepID=A0ABS5FLC8_9BRAD|nr:hypothetical protein [Bradyrhizobium jicamae]MBR0797586.1 hypothetical protein [Bradyrhizobium jicamae]MBR0937250.1 hypothetical protein [Bradyrhizobium jicamae]
MWRTILLTILVLLAVLNLGYRGYLLRNAPHAVKARCAREPVNILRRSQYSNCLAREWH